MTTTFDFWRTSVIENSVIMPISLEAQYESILAKYMAINLAFTKDLDDETKVELMKRNILLSIELFAPYVANQSLERLHLLKEHIENK